MTSFFNKLTGRADDGIKTPGEQILEGMHVHVEQTAPTPPRFTRPGDSPAVPYIENTRSNLTKIVDKYRAEDDALSADIARLIEEQRQLRSSILALDMALGVIEGNDLTVDPVPHDGEV